MKILLNLLIIILASGGFALAFYIYKSKLANKRISCPLDGHCESVIYSEYSKFFGIPLEILGMLYYSVVVAAYVLFISGYFPSIPVASLGVLGLTGFSFLFSLYLVFIQAFNLKQWCSWCLISAAICSFLLLASLMFLRLGFIAIPFETFEGIRNALQVGHLLAVALGFGSSVIWMIFFAKFIKDLYISNFEKDTMGILAQTMWFSLFILLLSGFGLYIPYGSMVLAPEILKVFLIEVSVFAFLLVSVAIMDLLIFPDIVKKSLIAAKDEQKNAVSSSKRKFSLVLNSVIVFLWLSMSVFITALKF